MPLSDMHSTQPGAVSVAAKTIVFSRDADGSLVERVCHIPVEVPVAILYGNQPYAVMMQTPADLEDFAYGFSISEGIIERADDIRTIDITSDDEGIHVSITLQPDRFKHHLARQRSLAGRTSCGMCGITHLEDVRRAIDPSTQVQPPLEIAALQKALGQIDQHQTLNQETRAVHGAAWFTSAGDFVALREDVGRHNALDKLIGALVRSQTHTENGFLIITSRCSFEMVEKAAAAGMRTIVAISAPTSLALERATHLGITLIAIARSDSALLFTPGALNKGTLTR